MPRVKIDYVVSFSSEDPENQANNLLAWDVSKKKWLCNKGELSCSVVLQLTKAIKVESINIGAYHAALLEVLVGLSEKPNDPFQVLVPNCVLLNPTESRRGDNVERVRSFSGTQLAGDARDRRWDRVRVVCSQPYNKHCQYGLSFVHIYEPEERSNTTSTPSDSASTPTPALPARVLRLETYSSDEDEFRPGELFAKHLSQEANTSTEAQIRQASSQALKNISDSATKLHKTPISKTNHKVQNHTNGENLKNRQKDSLMYTDDDDQPHTKIDYVVQRHKEGKQKQEDSRVQNKREKEDRIQKPDRDKRNESFKENKKDNTRRQETPSKREAPVNSVASNSNKKRKRSVDKSSELLPGPVCSLPNEVLSGVEFALSGYMNPQRSTLRCVATALGARYKHDWVPSCTHLVCAFPNTPKLKTVRASRASTVAVTGEWLEECNKHRRRLPWQWFATEPKYRVKPPEDWEKREATPDGEENEEMDTDDEIEKVLKQQDKKRRISSPTHAAHEEPDSASTSANRSADSDVAFVKDERIQGSVSILDTDSDADCDTDEDTRQVDDPRDCVKELPNFFEGSTFVISEELDAEYDRELLARYIRAYGGLLLQGSELLEESKVEYKVCTTKEGEGDDGVTKCVSPEWVWRCHQKRQRLPHEL